MSENTFDPTESFRREAADLIDQLEEALMRMESGDHSKDVVDEAFRAMHTIKGSGSMFGFERMAEFTHHFETAFDKVRTGEVEVSDELTDSAIQALDYIKDMMEERYDEERAEKIIFDLNKIVSGGEITTQETITEQPEASTNSNSETKTETSQTTTRCYKVIYYPGANSIKFGANHALLLDELRELGDAQITILTDRLPSWDSFEPELCYTGWEIILNTEAGLDEIDDVFIFVKDESDLTIEELANRQSDPPPQIDQPVQSGSTTQNQLKPSAKTDTTVRIPSARLDAMMDQVGELVIAQSRLAELAEQLDNAGLRAVHEDMERLVMDLRDQALEVRMLPIGTLFSKFKRVVRDLSKELGKSVELIVEGEDTEVDKTFIDKLNDPIVHLIRNSMDHGLEDRETRLANGKPEKGMIRLVAAQSGGEILVSIEDDGAGLNVERIKTKAIENGLIGNDDVLSDEQIHRLIFEAGFSTAAEVSSVSGRGVGMDVVRSNIEEMRGKIDVRSTTGAGSTFTLRLPLTLAIIEGYHVRVGDEAFVMPLELVEECVELTKEEDMQPDGRSLISIRDEFVPFVRLHDVFGFEYPSKTERRVVVVSVAGQRVGLVVDHIYGQRQTVIKPLSKIHSGIKGLAGATILGDGRVALILDIPSLLDRTKLSAPIEPKEAA